MAGVLTWQDVLRPSTSEPEGLAILPPGLVAELQASGWRPQHAQVGGIEHQRVNFLVTELLEAAGTSVQPFGPEYHNSDHFRAVYAGVREQLFQRMTHDRPVPVGIRHALLLAAAGHDRDHPGSTFRHDAPAGVAAPELGTDISNEMASAILVDRWASKRQVPIGVRVAVAQLIDATTFGVPGKGPTTEYERILVCADIAPEEDFWRWLDSGLDVSYREIPAKPAPDDFNGWVANRLGFLGHIERNLTPEAVELGWGRRVTDHRARLKQIQAGTSPNGCGWAGSMPAQVVRVHTTRNRSPRRLPVGRAMSDSPTPCGSRAGHLPRGRRPPNRRADPLWPIPLRERGGDW